MRAKLFIALGTLTIMVGAVPIKGTAFSFHAGGPQVSQQGTTSVRLRVDKNRGVLATAWLNGGGPYVFAIDTGAGMNLISQRVVNAAHLPVRTVQATVLGGLTTATTTSNREAVMTKLALGVRSNSFRDKTALVVSTLGQGIDGILDPTDIYSPNGYSIDLQNQRLEAVYSDANVPQRQPAGEGAVVPWVRLGGSFRPFVRLGDGRLALIDTGSGFGLAVNERNAVVVGGRRNSPPPNTNHDLGGGTISSRRVAPTTISIGGLVLRGVPTDILFGVEDNAPLILGRDALYPFKITFDPQKRLIGFVTSQKS